MKKIISLILMTVMLAAAVSSCVGGGTTTEPLQTTSTTEATTTFVTNAVYNGMTPSNEPPTDIKGEPVVKIMMYSWDGRGLEYDIIKGSAAKQLEEIFARLQKTGETEEKYSDFDGKFDNDNYELIRYELHETEITPGTVWIEVGGKLYRNVYNIDKEKSRFCLVENHFGAGEVVSISEEDLKIYNAIRNYWPNNYYSGTYKDGTLELGHLYAAESRINLKVLGCAEEKNSEKWSLFLEVSSKEGGEFVIKSESELSGDNLLRHYSVKVNLLPGETKIVELPFAVHKHWHSWTRVEADNTVISIHIDR